MDEAIRVLTQKFGTEVRAELKRIREAIESFQQRYHGMGRAGHRTTGTDVFLLDAASALRELASRLDQSVGFEDGWMRRGWNDGKGFPPSKPEGLRTQRIMETDLPPPPPRPSPGPGPEKQF